MTTYGKSLLEQHARKLALEITKEAIDRGEIIELGFLGLRALWFPHAGTDQTNDMRIAFHAGAAHLFRSIMGALDPGEDETSADLSRMESIEKEVRDIEQYLLANRPKKKEE